MLLYLDPANAMAYLVWCFLLASEEAPTHVFAYFQINAGGCARVVI
jgi:hypothetical protein